jgi:predicted lipid-binding transport protein (Tim44 family)
MLSILGGGIACSATIPRLVIARKGNESRVLLEKLRERDPIWDPDSIERRVDHVFYNVQEAWMERDQDIARDCGSDRLYAKHKAETDRMLADHRTNVLESITLDKITVVEVEDSGDESRDHLWAMLKGSMYDYTVDDRTETLLSGSNTSAERFSELWKFVRGANDWVLDEIVPRVGFIDPFRFKSSSRSLSES